MKDFRGQSFNVGDTVAFIEFTSTRSGRFLQGKVVGTCKRGRYSCVEIEVNNSHGHIEVRSEHNVAKL